MFAAVTFVLLLAVGPFLGFRAYGRYIEGMDTPVEDRLHRLNRVQQVAGFVLPVVAIGGLYALGLLGRATAIVGAVGPELFGLAVSELAVLLLSSFGIVTVPLVSMTLGTSPTVRSLRGTAASTWRAVSGVGTVMASAAVTVAIVLVGFVTIRSLVGSSFSIRVATLGVIVFASFGLSPYLLMLSQDRLPLEGTRRERLERLCEEVGYSPRGVYLLEGESTKTATALVAGTIPGLRYVFLTDYLLAECDDDELRSVLAHEFGHVAGHHLWQRGVLTITVFGIGVVGIQRLGLGWLAAQFGFAGLFVPFLALYALYHVVLLGGLARWQEFRADAYAARTAGREAMVAALETLADANDVRRETGLLYSLATHHPPIAARLDALSDSDGERSEPTPNE